ncbi:hypothetical protein N0V84_010304 [Fusarium piperis]|uniref:Uncharacterized protein n=1 Tax=Fusarium piperis TaxID=1435070 RepID=A0A9W8TCH1_9HYPO|nr:hypothetical protein N0V84_010304 [Fusarium piperis]
MVGPNYGDFHIQRRWTQNAIRVLDLAQDSNVVLRLAVREFVPGAEELRSDDTRGNKMYGIPWAITDPEEATKAVNLYIDRCIGTYLVTILDDSNHLVWDMFHWAMRLSTFPEPNQLLSDVIRLWVVCRFLEGRWRCVGVDTLGAEGLSHWYDNEPLVQVPPFVNYQMAALFTERILQPLRVTVLKQLQDLILANETRNWFPITLSVFILLHNYEMQCRFHRAFAMRRGFSVRFVEMPIIRAIHSGAKTILAHFHYACKGQRPFSMDHDWNSDEAKRMAHLDDEQIGFLMGYQYQVESKAPTLRSVSLTHDYEEEYWFVGQMFDADWVPRQTNEYSPPA